MVETAEFTADYSSEFPSEPDFLSEPETGEIVERPEAEQSAVFTPEAGAEESAEADSEPWRPAIHLPLADPYQAPEGYFIKANTHSGLYYTPDSALYDNTLPEVWFASEEVAQANGFVRAPE